MARAMIAMPEPALPSASTHSRRVRASVARVAAAVICSSIARATSGRLDRKRLAALPRSRRATVDKALVSVVLRNTGSTAWRKGTEQEARLGIPGNSPDLAFLGDAWPTPERPAVQWEDIVPPGGTATFSFFPHG